TSRHARKAIDAAERFAEGHITNGTAANWDRKVHDLMGRMPEKAYFAYLAISHALSPESYGRVHELIAKAAAYKVARRPEYPKWEQALVAETQAMIPLLHDIIGNPFNVIVAASGWRTSNVLHLARAIYSEANFRAMPILGDALEESGCNVSALLNHCRG